MFNTNKDRIPIEKILGVSEDKELVVVEDLFKHSEDFKGVTGWRMTPVTQQDIDDNNTPDIQDEYILPMWKDAVANDQTTESFENYREDVISQLDYSEELWVGDDPSFRTQTEELFNTLPEETQEKILSLMSLTKEELVTWDCTSCGRCISPRSNFLLVVDKELLEKCKEYEED